MSIVFQFFLIALVLFSLLMVIGVPVAYASPPNWDAPAINTVSRLGVQMLPSLSQGLFLPYLVH